MAIEWYSEAEAERMFEPILTDWAQNFQYKGCYSPEETQKAIGDVKNWARKSSTAKKLMFFVEISFTKFIVVGMRGGYQCFDSTAGPDKNLPVVFVDLDGKLTVNVRGPHNLHLDPNLCSGNVLPLDNGIALLHEFGHVRQWIERPTMFDNKKPASSVAKPRFGGGQFDARLEKATFARQINEGAKKLWDSKGDSSSVQTTEERGEFKAPVWGPPIEMDNMSRHEWPICRELGLPLRANYRDINCTSDGAPSLTSTIRQKIALAAQKEKDEMEAKRAELTKLSGSGQALTCSCKQTFKSKIFLNRHLQENPSHSRLAA